MKLRSLKAMVLLASPILLASCVFTPPPAAGITPVEIPGGFTRSGQADLVDRWWQSFGDAELDRLVGVALGRNLRLKSAWDRLDQAAATARKSGASLALAVDLDGGVSRSRSKTDTTFGSTVTADSYSVGLAASYEVDLWGRIRSSRDAAALDVRASREDLMTTAMTLSAEVAVTWYRLVQARSALELLGDQEAVSRKFLDLVEVRFGQGRATSVAVLQQRRQLEATRSEIPLARMRRDMLQHRLAVLLGRPPQRKVAGPGAKLPELSELPQTGLPADLVRRRPDLRASFHRIEAADKRVAAAVADRFPTLRLTSRVETRSAESSNLFTNWLASLAGGLLGPIFDAGRRKAEVHRSRAAALERLHLYGQSVLDAFREVEDSLTQERMQRDYVAGLAKQLEIVRAELARARERYANGATDYLPVLTAVQSMQRLELQYLGAELLLIEYRIGLHRALGGGWSLERPGDDPGETLAEPGI